MKSYLRTNFNSFLPSEESREGARLVLFIIAVAIVLAFLIINFPKFTVIIFVVMVICEVLWLAFAPTRKY